MARLLCVAEHELYSAGTRGRSGLLQVPARPLLHLRIQAPGLGIGAGARLTHHRHEQLAVPGPDPQPVLSGVR